MVSRKILPGDRPRVQQPPVRRPREQPRRRPIASVARSRKERAAVDRPIAAKDGERDRPRIRDLRQHTRVKPLTTASPGSHKRRQNGGHKRRKPPHAPH